MCWIHLINIGDHAKWGGELGECYFCWAAIESDVFNKLLLLCLRNCFFKMWINWDNSQKENDCETPSIKCMVHGWSVSSMIILWDAEFELPWDYSPKMQITQECSNWAYVPRKRANHLILNFPLLVFILNLSEITLYHVQSCLWLLSLPFSLSHSDDEGNLGVLCRSDCLAHPIACLQQAIPQSAAGSSPVCKSMGRIVSVFSKTAPSLQDCYPVQMQSQFLIHCFAPVQGLCKKMGKTGSNLNVSAEMFCKRALL